MATFVIYPDSWDVWATDDFAGWEATREDIHNHAVSHGADPDQTLVLNNIFAIPDYVVWAGFLNFDTSVIGSSIVTSASLFLCSAFAPLNQSGLIAEIYSYPYTPPITAWVKGSQLSGLPLIASAGAAGGVDQQYTQFLDSGLANYINTSGHTGLHVNTNFMRLDIETGKIDQWAFYSPDTVGTEQDPKLLITAQFPSSALGGTTGTFNKMQDVRSLTSP